MADNSWDANSRPLLSGLFGVLQSTAGAYQSTADVWSSLRIAAGTWQYQAGGGGDIPPVDQLEATGAQILSESGIGIQQVNSYRALAGQWRSAKDALMSADQNTQITAQQIFVPPWARTLDEAVPSRYRVRVLWDAEDAAGNPFQSWGTYELTAPLTTIEDALRQAQNLVGTKPNSDMPPGATVVGAADYEISQV